MLLVLLALAGCTDDIGKDSDPAHIRAALCMRVKRPPRAKCEDAAKQTAIEAVRSRPTDGKFYQYNTDCEEALAAVTRFTPESSEAHAVIEACCTIPDEQKFKQLIALCDGARPSADDSAYVRGRVAAARVAGVIDVDTMREVSARCAKMQPAIAECAEAAKYARKQP